MILPLYHDHQAPPALPDGGHRGLWYDRFFDRYDDRDQWKIPDEGKAGWVKDNAKPTGDRDQLDQAAQRHLALITALGGRGAVFQTDWHFATGLGLPHPVENGLAWHSTLGVPYLAGSGVKGLVRAWVEIWDESLGDPRSEQRQQRLDTWFGTLKQAGGFLFFDALPIEPVNLVADVMTPHLGKWYEQGGEIADWRREPDKIPADWHAPVPVPFLVAKKPKLLFGIAPRNKEFAAELDAVFAALKQALEWLGAGAKTAVGYGVMAEKPKDTEDLQQIAAATEQRQREAARIQQQHVARQTELEDMDPFERMLAETLGGRADKGQTDIVYLIGLLKSGHWQGEDKQRVAQWLERRMKDAKGQWKPQSQAKKPEKDREHQNTLLVMSWLKD
ncbi:type III-B CRISPR module RAMP protein Cmr6 [uncultured Thiocystis sp.]|jgi:CRISPR-associated protein Cmr6|uniref:type III-B CRISPR module RAMP protein Cmr6 n=1 Tax=uncultured Thiocystis sp. TaxID=1202134 RepID=UPI0025FFE678|nr:type III-B CRISPR module RAMP protein Cmr6 [uncultured Thiocystis sp.]